MNCIKTICINREDLASFSSQLRTGFWQHWPFGTIPHWGHPPPLEAEEVPQRESLNPVQNPPAGEVLQDILLQDSDGPEPWSLYGFLGVGDAWCPKNKATSMLAGPGAHRMCKYDE